METLRPTRRSALRSMLPALALALVGCGTSDAAEDRANQAYQLLRDREVTHHAIVMAANERGAIDQETTHYVHDMDRFAAELSSACTDMMFDGAMMGRSVDELHDIVDDMHGEQSDHRDGLADSADVAAMHEECTSHHDMMVSHLDRIAAVMSNAGMRHDR